MKLNISSFEPECFLDSESNKFAVTGNPKLDLTGWVCNHIQFKGRYVLLSKKQNLLENSYQKGRNKKRPT